MDEEKNWNNWTLKLERDGDEQMHMGREFQSLMTERRKETDVARVLQKGG